jgi:prepilin-type N-terminal cleavage/methylation domain-containing protein
MKNCREKRNIDYSQAGFSLLEMIIAVTVFLIVTSAVYGLLKVGIISRNTINNRSESITNARAAVNSVGKDVINAGLGFSRVGGVVPDDFVKDHLNTRGDSGSQRDLLTAIVAGNNVRESDLSVSGQKNDIIAFAFRDLQFNGGNSISITDAPILSITDNSIVLKTPTDACANCRPFDLYLVESGDGKQAVVMATAVPDTNTIVLGRNDPLGLNQTVIDSNSDKRSILTKCILGNTVNCVNYASGVTAKKIYWISFSVDVDGTLVRTTYGNNTGGTAAQQIQRNPIAHGVQNFQVRYLMQDGTISEDPSQNNDFPMKMNEVVQVEITMTIKSANDEGSVTNTELLNVTSTFSTRNLKYDIE